MPKVPTVCSLESCDTVFYVRPYLARDGKPHYCSLVCRYASQRVEYTEEEKRARNAAYMRKHRAQFTQEELREKWLAEYYTNHDARVESIRRYRDGHRPETQAQQRAHKREWAAENPEIIHERNKRYYDGNTEKWVGYNTQRRARLLSAPINDLTPQQWQEIKEHYGHRCVYCGRKMQRLTQDHITPLSQGGSHTASNIVPACQPCNSKKRTGPPPLPVQPLLFTIAPKKVITEK